MGNCITTSWTPPVADRVRNAVIARRNVQLSSDCLQCHLSNDCRAALRIEGGTDEVKVWHQDLVASRTQEQVRAWSRLTALLGNGRAIAPYPDSRKLVPDFHASPLSAPCERSSSSESR
jgi:hypothetical protein